VTIFVQDLNDNSPTIRVNALTAAGHAEIDENLPGGSFVAHVSVTDLDTDSGGQVRLKTHTSFGQLYVNSSGIFQRSPTKPEVTEWHFTGSVLPALSKH